MKFIHGLSLNQNKHESRTHNGLIKNGETKNGVIKKSAQWLKALSLTLVSISCLHLPLQAHIVEDKNGKFLGNISRDKSANKPGTTPENFTQYWDQVTPGNSGKWGFVESTRNTMNWEALDRAYNLAKDNNNRFKHHVLIWGNQSPAWLDALPAQTQLAEIEEWMAAVCYRYPDIDQIEVVNEGLANHNPPDGGTIDPGSSLPDGSRGNFIEALGGWNNGTDNTGYDWIIKSFELARQHCPDKELLLNDYGILGSKNYQKNDRAKHIKIANLLKERGLIDAIAAQGHSFTVGPESNADLTTALDELASTGLPVYVTELELDPTHTNVSHIEADDLDAKQLLMYQEVFPAIWEHPAVQGVTLWGYIKNDMWKNGAYLVDDTSIDAQERPAMIWLKDYIEQSHSLKCSVDADIVAVNAPLSIAQGSTVNVHINYDAPATCKINTVLQTAAGFNKIASETVIVSAGSGSTTLNLSIPNDAPVADNGYQLQTYITTTDGGWNKRADNIVIPDIDITTPVVGFYLKSKGYGTYLHATDDIANSLLQAGEKQETDYFKWEKVATSDPDQFHFRNLGNGMYFRPVKNVDGALLDQRTSSYTGDYTKWKEVLSEDGHSYFFENVATGRYFKATSSGTGNIEAQPASWTGDYMRWQYEL